MRELKGRTAVITGAGSGIGRGLSLAFAEAGMNIVAADIRLEAAEETCALLEPHGVKSLASATDVTDAAAMAQLAARTSEAFGEVHLLCNNAGVCLFGPLESMSPADWEWLLSVNLKGVVNGLDAFLPLLRAHGQPAHVVNTASLAGLASFPKVGVYTATKFAVVGLTEVLSEELSDSPIGVSVLCPAAVDSEIFVSDQTRPAELGDSGPGAVMVSEDHVKSHGMAPLKVGQAVRQAVIDGDLYIFTHPNIRKHVDARHKRMSEAFDRWEAYFGTCTPK